MANVPLPLPDNGYNERENENVPPVPLWDNSSNESENENVMPPVVEEEEEAQVISLCIDAGENVRKSRWAARLFDIRNVTIHDPVLG